jgi:hypothetical protein
MNPAQADRLLEDKVVLKRLAPSSAKAGLLVCSLPLPRGVQTDWQLDGRATARQALGQWPGTAGTSPRRLLLAADGGATAPESLRLTRSGTPAAGAPPTAELVRFAESPTPEFYWERHLLKISWGGVSLGLVMGLRTGNEVHWWEACGLVTRSETPECRVIEAGGAIPLVISTADDLRAAPGYRFPFLHKHNWLNGHVYARLHANGVCEIFAHHINAKFADDGLALENAVPVLGFHVEGMEPESLRSLVGPWDGTHEELALGSVRLDCRDVNRLATPRQPGVVDLADGFLVWQPYQAMELYGGLCPHERTGDPWILHPEQKQIPRGMARTLRFSVSLNPARSPRVVRYQAPAWWYGLCEEFSPAPLLPVSNEYDRALDGCRAYVRFATHQGGFEDGSISRHQGKDEARGEPGWEGEAPYGQFLRAWRTGDAEDHDLALRTAYYVSDVSVDHAACAFRMHGFAPIAFALPMQRIHASVAAYLDTGDPYLFQTARSVLDNAYWTHKNSWPRLAVGRDACFVRGAVLLYRYFADEHYRALARDAAGDVAATQRPDGSFGDQGGGAGLHAFPGYVTKPWMGCMAVGGLIDYLEVVGDEPELLDTVKKFADWMLRDRREHQGVKGLRYQHNYRGGPDFYDFRARKWVKLPGDWLWHVEYLARVWPFCALRFGDPAYFDAWAESYAAHTEPCRSDHSFAQACQYLPWLQDRLWNVRLNDQGGLDAVPVAWGPRTPKSGKVHTPEGLVSLEWTELGKRFSVNGKVCGLLPGSQASRKP